MTPVAALQSAMAAEHEALYLFGAYGARTSQSAEPALYATVTEGYLTHRARRDHLERVVTALGEEPVALRLPRRCLAILAGAVHQTNSSRLSSP